MSLDAQLRASIAVHGNPSLSFIEAVAEELRGILAGFALSARLTYDGLRGLAERMA